MRRDSIGFFWQDIPESKPEKVEKVKRQPPERTWERPDYLPHLTVAMAFEPDFFTDVELVRAAALKETLTFDCEVYPNYFLAAFKSLESHKVLCFESYPGHPIDCAKLRWVLQNFRTIGFNSLHFDMPIISLAVANRTTQVIKAAADMIIQQNMRGFDVLKQFKAKYITGCDHIDLIEVAPLFSSLKIYGGRMHAERMQDLPFSIDTELSSEQAVIVRWYCVNDLDTTELLYRKLEKQIQLRESLSEEYGIDLRSKSDAQIAEAVISQEVMKLNGGLRIAPQQIDPGTRYKYNIPSFIRFQSPMLHYLLGIVAGADFVVANTGAVGMPTALKELQLRIGGSTYRMGIGGLHSSEQSVSYYEDANYILMDKDVTSYYPSIILNLGLFPEQMGRYFLTVYQRIVDKRLAAKKAGVKTVADALKITINGAFGKLGSMFSKMYSPRLLIQVTLTGQLSLLMLIERLELNGISVVSANTDGIMTHCPRDKIDMMQQISKQWEIETGFEMEDKPYKSVHHRDVNNYVAVEHSGEFKSKGVFADVGLSKTPANQVCVDAVIQHIIHGTPIDGYIRCCEDVRKFVTVRTVKGGAVKDGEYLGKAIRWYYGAGQEGEIVYALSGNKVPKSEGAVPLMLLPRNLPDNVDYERYILEANEMLTTLGTSPAL